MGKLAENIRSLQSHTDMAQVALRNLAGDKKYNQVYDAAHFITTPMITARNQTKAAEAALQAQQDQPVMPVEDDSEIERARRRALQRQASGRASTVLGGASESLG